MTDTKRDPLFSETNLIWIDLEMTGLQPEVNRIIELGAIITDAQLNVIHEGPVIAIHQDKSILDAMDEWNTKTHGKSGLIDRVLASTIDEEEASDICIETFSRFVPAGKSPLCGSTIGQDRRGAIDPAFARAGCLGSRTSSTIARLTSHPSRSSSAAGSLRMCGLL